MSSEWLEELDRNTAYYMIDEMYKKLRHLNDQVRKKDVQIN